MKRKLTITIPPGINEDYQMRLSGEGEAGIYGGSPGDIYVTFSIGTHNIFKRENTNIFYELPVNFAQAALGASVEIPTLDGKAQLKIPQGTQNGKVIRIKDHGVLRLNGKGRGDQLVIIRVVTPQSLDYKQRRLLEELAETLPEAKIPEDEREGIIDRIKSALSDN